MIFWYQVFFRQKNLTATQSPYRMHAGAANSSFCKQKYSGRFPRVKTIQPNQT